MIGEDSNFREYVIGRRRLAWFSLVLGVASATGALWAAGMEVRFAPALGFVVVVVALLAAAHHIYGHWRGDERLSLVTGGLAVMIAAPFLPG